MKRLLPLLLIFTLTACSTGGNEFQPNEQSFISGNGIVTIIEKSEREIAPPITGPLLDGGNYLQDPGRVQLMNVWASWCSFESSYIGASFYSFSASRVLLSASQVQL